MITSRMVDPPAGNHGRCMCRMACHEQLPGGRRKCVWIPLAIIMQPSMVILTLHRSHKRSSYKQTQVGDVII